MLLCPVFAKRISRLPAVPSLSRIPIPQPLPPKSHGIISFADPHPLNPVVSYRYKNLGGRGRFAEYLSSSASASASVNSVPSAPSALIPLLSFDVQLSIEDPERLGTLNFQPSHPITPFLATHPQNAPLTPFLATHPKPPSRKPFVCHTSETPQGVGVLWLTRHPTKGVCPERPLRARDLSLHPTKDFYPEGASLLRDRSSFQVSTKVLTSGPQVRGIHFDGDRPHNQIEREDKPQLLLFPHDDSFQARERPVGYSHSPAHFQIRMRFRAKLARKAAAQGFHFVVGKRHRRTAKSHQASNRRNIQNTQSLSQREVHENVAWKQWQLQLNPAIFPSAHTVVQRQKMLHPTLAELIAHALLMVREGAHRVPARIEVVIRQERVFPRIQRNDRYARCRALHLDLPPTPYIEDPIQLRPVSHKAIVDLTL